MALTKIAEAISEVEAVTGKEARSIGATIFVNGELTDEEKTKIEHRINPQNISKTAQIGKLRTQIDL
jgi:hypothetical protein